MPLNPLHKAVPVLAALGIAGLFFFQARFTDPAGTDGYYYLKQVEVLSQGGGYYYKDHSLAFLAPAAIAAVCGSSLVAYRLAVAFTGTLLILAGGMLAYLAAIDSGVERRTAWFLFLLSTAALACSLTIYEFTFEYLKNAFALLLLVMAVLFSLAGPSEPGIKGKVGVFLLVLSGLLSHKSALFFTAVFAATWFVRNASRKNLLVLAAAGTSGLALFLVAFDRGRQYLSALPGFLGSADRWSAWFVYTLRNDPALSLAMAAAVFSLALYFPRRRHFPDRVTQIFDTVAVILVIAFVPFLVPGPSGPGYRIILFSPLFSVPLLLLSSSTGRPGFRTAGAILLFVFLAQTALGHSRIDNNFPAWSSLDQDIVRIQRHVTPNDHLIAHHGLEFYVDYRTGLRARQFIASDSRKKSFRLAYVPEGRPGGEARAALESVKLEQIGQRYALFREDQWRQIAERYGIRPHWKNPTAGRPDYIPDYD